MSEDRLQDPRFWRAMAQQVEAEGWSWFAWGATLVTGDQAQWDQDEAVVKAAASAHGFDVSRLKTAENLPVQGTWILRSKR